MIEALKGLSYVIVTTVLLWFLCRSWSQQVADALSKYEQIQSRYELYVKNSPIAISAINQQGQFVEVNEATEELTGYNAEELRELTIFDITMPDDHGDTKVAFENIFRQGHATRDRTIVCKDSSHKIIRVDGVRHTEEQAICFASDISDRKHYEHRLLRLNAMLRAIRRVNKAIVGTSEIDVLIRKICEILVEDREFKHAWIALLDNDGTPLHYHDAPKLKDANKLKDFLQAGHLPKCLENTKTEDGLILATHPVEQCPGFPIMAGMEDCALIGVEFSYDHSFGYIALMANRDAIDDDEEIDLFREVAEDLRFALQSIKAEAERKIATEDLIVAKQSAEKANQAKDDFLSVMSHELRTPLNPIMGYTSLLLETSNDPECIKSLEDIYRSSEQLLTLINDILFFSQLQEGPKSYPNTHIDLLGACEASVEQCRSQHPQQSIQFENGTGDYRAIEPDTQVGGDVEYLQRLLDGLLGNACKYTHEGDIYLRVGQRELDSGTLEAIFEIEDSGIGIEKEVLNKLFDPFTQLDSSKTRRYQGIGLGLAICRKIADVMGGSLTAESEPGVGSCFRFCCTLKKVDGQKISKQSHTTVREADKPSAGRVLLVEDNLSNALIAKAILKRWGLKVELAEQGRSAVEMCRDNRYELILMDLSMPIMNGFDATKEIRNSDTPNRQTPIFGLTAHVSTDVEAACYAAGMNGFVAKPIQQDVFKQCLSQYVVIIEQPRI